VITGISRVASLKILGVTINSQLSVIKHVSSVIGAGAQTIHSLRILRSHTIAVKLFSMSTGLLSSPNFCNTPRVFSSVLPMINAYKRPSDAASVLDCATPASQLWLNWLTLLMKHFSNVLFTTQIMYCISCFLSHPLQFTIFVPEATGEHYRTSKHVYIMAISL